MASPDPLTRFLENGLHKTRSGGKVTTEEAPKGNLQTVNVRRGCGKVLVVWPRPQRMTLHMPPHDQADHSVRAYDVYKAMGLSTMVVDEIIETRYLKNDVVPVCVHLSGFDSSSVRSCFDIQACTATFDTIGRQITIR